jgi:hypothetical protein
MKTNEIQMRVLFFLKRLKCLSFSKELTMQQKQVSKNNNQAWLIV